MPLNWEDAWYEIKQSRETWVSVASFKAKTETTIEAARSSAEFQAASEG